MRVAVGPRVCAKTRWLSVIMPENRWVRIEGICQSVRQVHLRFGTKSLAYETYELDMQIPGELSDSSLSPTETQARLKGAHRPSQLIDLTEVSRVLKALLKTRTNLRLRTKLLLRLVLFTAAGCFPKR